MLSDDELAQYKIRTKDANGRLLRSGFWWYEFRPIAFMWLAIVTTLSAAGVVGAAIGIGFAVANRNVGDGLTAASVGSLCAAALIWVRYVGTHYRQLRRQVVFCKDGQILFSFTRYQDCRKEPALYPLKKRIDSIQTFGAVRGGKVSYGSGSWALPYTVLCYFDDGQEFPLTINQPFEDTARIVVVQLTLALNEIRAANNAGAVPKSTRTGIV